MTPPVQTDILACQATEYCTGIQCCVAIDIKITQLYLNAWLAVDPCNFELTVGLGIWNYTKAMIASDWGVEGHFTITDTFHIRY